MRRPEAQISGRTPVWPANGFDAGTVYGAAPFTSIRSILPSRVVIVCALFCGSPPLPPSPSPMYRNPSGPKASIPPLWLAKGCVWVNTVSAEAGFATFGSADTVYRTTRVSPAELV